MENLFLDLRLALRSLLRTPGFTAAAVITLALGIGATTALFSVVDAVLLRPLGWGDESRLFSLTVDFPGRKITDFSLSLPEFADLRDSSAFENAGAYTRGTAALLTTGDAERVNVGIATAGFFPALGVTPVYGRSWTNEEDMKGAAQVVMLSYAAFQKRYGGSPGIVGSDVTLDGSSRRVIGVLPKDFYYGTANELWLPLEIAAGWQNQRGAHYLQGVARLKHGVTAEAARQVLANVSQLDLKNYPDEYTPEDGVAFRMAPLRDRFIGSTREPLLFLLAAVFLVLLIACANVAGLLLARAASRQTEIAVRAALGASRLRLLQQLFTESLLLAVMGAALGVLTAQWSLSGLLLAAPRNVRLMTNLTLDPHVLVFSLAVTVLCTLAFGLWPSLRASRADLAAALKDGSRSISGGARLRSALVVGQFALSLALLASAGLVLRSFAKILQVSPGFEAEGVVEVRAEPGGKVFEDDAARQRYFDRAYEALKALPGVTSLGGVDRLPNEGDFRLSYFIEGYTPAAGEPQPSDLIRRAFPGNFATLHQRVVQGREFALADDAKAPLVALVNEAWVRRYYPGRDVIGHRIRMDSRSDQNGEPWRTIVGIVGDAREFGPEKPVPPVYYFASAQMPPDRMTFVLRSANPKALLPQAREAVARLDRTQPAGESGLLTDSLSSSLASRRFPLQLLACFALLALLLSAVGIYGVTAYAVAQRTREFGVRMAVGATGGEVIRMVLKRALGLALAGIAAGILAAFASVHLLASQLVAGVSPHDPLTYFTVAGVLALVALIASALPAIRASRIDPMIALRAE
jgi:putative ABC transport system permease protein